MLLRTFPTDATFPSPRLDLAVESMGSHHVYRISPLLDEVVIERADPYNLPVLSESEREGFKPATLSLFRGSLLLSKICQANDFVLELARSRVQYHVLSFHDVTAWMGIRELIVACAPAL